MFLRACETKEGHFRWIFVHAVTHFEKGKIIRIPNVSEYAMTFCEGILFVATLEKAGCSEVLEISSWVLLVGFFLDVYIYF